MKWNHKGIFLNFDKSKHCVTQASVKIENITIIPGSSLRAITLLILFHNRFILEFYINEASFTQHKVFEIQTIYILDRGAPNPATDSCFKIYPPKRAHTNPPAAPWLSLLLFLPPAQSVSAGFLLINQVRCKVLNVIVAPVLNSYGACRTLGCSHIIENIFKFYIIQLSFFCLFG